MNLEHFDAALDRAKEMTNRLHNSQLADLHAQIIHAIELLADEVAKLEKE